MCMAPVSWTGNIITLCFDIGLLSTYLCFFLQKNQEKGFFRKYLCSLVKGGGGRRNKERFVKKFKIFHKSLTQKNNSKLVRR